MLSIHQLNLVCIRQEPANTAEWKSTKLPFRYYFSLMFEFQGLQEPQTQAEQHGETAPGATAPLQRPSRRWSCPITWWSCLKRWKSLRFSQQPCQSRFKMRGSASEEIGEQLNGKSITAHCVGEEDASNVTTNLLQPDCQDFSSDVSDCRVSIAELFNWSIISRTLVISETLRCTLLIRQFRGSSANLELQGIVRAVQ